MHPTSQTDLPALLDAPDVASWLKISIRQIRRLTASGSLPAIKIGHVVRFRPEDVKP